MRGTQTQTSSGRPPISNELWNQVVDLKNAGKTAAQVIETTGLGQTKVYEIFRNPVKKELEPAEPAA